MCVALQADAVPCGTDNSDWHSLILMLFTRQASLAALISFLALPAASQPNPESEHKANSAELEASAGPVDPSMPGVTVRAV
jgi:hypothetical protein